MKIHCLRSFCPDIHREENSLILIPVITWEQPSCLLIRFKIFQSKITCQVFRHGFRLSLVSRTVLSGRSHSMTFPGFLSKIESQDAVSSNLRDHLDETETPPAACGKPPHWEQPIPSKPSNSENDCLCSLTLKAMREGSWRHQKHKPSPQNPNSRCFSQREVPQGCLHEQRGMWKSLLLSVPFHKPQSAEPNSTTKHFLHKHTSVTAR